MAASFICRLVLLPDVKLWRSTIQPTAFLVQRPVLRAGLLYGAGVKPPASNCLCPHTCMWGWVCNRAENSIEIFLATPSDQLLEVRNGRWM
jgi:hypothetical protein